MSCTNGYEALETFKYFEDGNPGGGTAVSELYVRNMMTPNTIEFLKKNNIRGARLWDLYKNVCSRDGDQFVRVVKMLRDASDPEVITYYSKMEEELLTVLPFLRRFDPKID
jgi:hypothetical protein